VRAENTSRSVWGWATVKELELIEELADRILRDSCDPVVGFRLLRDVLRASRDSDEFVAARRGILKSRWVLELKREQREDGSWGRFHSAMKSKGKIVTTEAAVERGLALGLEASDPAFRAAIDYLSCLLDGSVGFPDPAERNDRWSAGTVLFAASTLARISPDLPILVSRGSCGLKSRGAPLVREDMMRRRRYEHTRC
jgi:hypothetical protein